jgi:protease-4
MRRWFLVTIAFAFTGCFNGFNGFLVKPVQCDAPVDEIVVYCAKHPCRCKDKVAIIDVDGVLMNVKGSTGGILGSPGENPVSAFREKLDMAATDKHVKAVVLRINSPGGAVTASDIMYRDLLEFREETKKPVVACMMDVAASGAYYMAMGADTVYAHPTTVTGSIGVIMNLYNAYGLFSMLGVKSDPIKSGKNKDIGNPLRPMTKEEREILQGTVDAFYGEFVKVVAKGRHMPAEHVKELADGRIYTGVEAKKLGLVDHVGYLTDAVFQAMDLACIQDAKVIAYDRNCGYKGSCYASGPRLPSEIKLNLDIPGMNHLGATFLYLWEPGLGQ